MGKTRGKNRFHRPNPAGLQNTRDELGSSFLDCSRDGALMVAVVKLQSAVSGDRECGAEALAMVACNKEAIEKLLERDIVRIASPLLLDKSLTVRHSIAGSLRNMTVVGGPAVCEHFVEKDVFTPVVHLYQEFYRDWKPAPPKEGKIDSSTEIYIEVTNLVWNLCESSEQAVAIFNKHHLLNIFLPCLNVSVFGPKVVLITAQCLQAVSENNEDVICSLPLGELKRVVTEVMSLEGTSPVHDHIRTLAAGIYLNLHHGTLSECTADESFGLLQVLSKTLSVSLNETVKTFIEKNADLKSSDKPEEQSAKADQEDLAKHDLMNVLSAKEVALEILTNICCDDEGADEWESLCSSEAGDDVEVPMEEDSQSEAASLPLPAETLAALVKLRLLPHVEEHAFIAEDVVSQFSDTMGSSDVQEKLEIMQCRALLCLHNMVSGGVEMDEVEKNGHLHQLWIRIAQLVLATAAKHKASLLEATSSCLRAIIQRLADEKSVSSVVHLTVDDLNALYKVTQDCADTKVRVNILRAVATVGILLQQDLSPQSEPLISNIGEFLLVLGSKDEDVWVNAEAADALMEVFAEDHLDTVVRQISLVDRCKAIHGILKCKARQLQKQLGENLPVVATAKTNLSRFIKYKSKLMSNGPG